MTERHDLWTLLDKLQMDIKAADAKLVSIRSMVAGLNLAPEHRIKCPVPGCGLPMKGPRTLAEHLHNSHDGPLPDHWAATDQIADEPVGAVRCPECGDDVTQTVKRKQQAGPQPPPPVVVTCRDGHTCRYAHTAEPVEAT